MLISLIIPVYNVDAYVAACLKSLLAQEYKGFEIILVDNNSTDRSIGVARGILEAQSLISYQILKEDVPGSCMARKKGVENANGDFICFIDADDEAYPRMLLSFVEVLERVSDIDIVVASYHILRGDKLEDASVQELLPVGNVGKKEALSILLSDKQKYYLWRTLFRKTLFNDITYPVNSILEDLQVLPLIYNNANHIEYIKEPVVLYKIRSGSLSNPSKKVDIKKFEKIPERIAYMRDRLLLSWKDDTGMVEKIYYFDFTSLKTIFNGILCPNLPYNELKQIAVPFQKHYSASYLKYIISRKKIRSIWYIFKLKVLLPYFYARANRAAN